MADYVVIMHQRGDKLTAESLPRTRQGYMTINLVVSGMLATGTWVESSSPDSDHGELLYSGAMQLIIAEDGNSMDGQWVGIGRDKQADGSFKPRIFNGRWELVRMKKAPSPQRDDDGKVLPFEDYVDPEDFDDFDSK